MQTVPGDNTGGAMVEGVTSLARQITSNPVMSLDGTLILKKV